MKLNPSRMTMVYVTLLGVHINREGIAQSLPRYIEHFAVVHVVDSLRRSSSKQLFEKDRSEKKNNENYVYI